jgi:hypothetical protein
MVSQARPDVKSRLDIFHQPRYDCISMKSAAKFPTLTPRDVQIVQMVYNYGGCGIAHVQRRLWPKDSAASGVYRRIAALTSARYLRTHRLPALIPQGSGKALLTPGSRAQQLPLDVDDSRPIQAYHRSHEISAFFAEHHFAICDFRVALELAAEAIRDVSFDGWVLESVLKRKPIRVPDVNQEPNRKSPPITIIPDGALNLSVAGEERVAYLEMDMGTIAHSRLKQRLRGYLLLNRSDSEPVPLFFVTTSMERVKNIVQAIDEQATELRCDPTTVFVTCWDDIAEDTLLTGAIWHRAGLSHPTAILPHAEFRRQFRQATVFERQQAATRAVA